MRNHSNENEFDLHENKHASETNFHMNGFALRFEKEAKVNSEMAYFINLCFAVICQFLGDFWGFLRRYSFFSKD